MKVTSRKTISFPKLSWGIERGEEKDLPTDKEAQEAILASPFIQPLGSKGKTSQAKADKEDKNDN